MPTVYPEYGDVGALGACWIRPPAEFLRERFRMRTMGTHRYAGPSKSSFALLKPAFAARVRLLGEHDVASGDELREALEALDGNLLVDLQSCDYIDSTIIRVLVAGASTRTRDGITNDRPPGPKIVRVLQLTDVPDVISARTIDDPDNATP